MVWPSFKAVRQRAVRRQASPNRLFCIDKGGAQKARQPRRAARQGHQPSLRHPARLANLLNAMTVVPLDQRCLKGIPARCVLVMLMMKSIVAEATSYSFTLGDQVLRVTSPRNLPIASPMRLRRAPNPYSRLSIAMSSC